MNDIKPPKDSYFEHSFAHGKGNSDASIRLSNNPPPGSVTFVVGKDDKLAMDGLNEIKGVNDLLSNPTSIYKWDTENCALTTVTPDHSTTALFFTRHLEDIGVLGAGETKKLETELARLDHLPALAHAPAEVQVAAEPVGDMVAALRQVEQLQMNGKLTAMATHTSKEEHNPASERLGSAAPKTPGNIRSA